MPNMVDSAADLDSDRADGTISAMAHANALAREARRNGYTARVTKTGQVLAIACDGGIIATTSATRLATWMGY